MRSKALPGWAHTLCTAAAALVFLLAYELVVYRVPVTEIFLPVSSWSDEVIYSKQLAAAVQYGAPQGYFGFNESHAPSAPTPRGGRRFFWSMRCRGCFCAGRMPFCGATCCSSCWAGRFSPGPRGLAGSASWPLPRRWPP